MFARFLTLSTKIWPIRIENRAKYYPAFSKKCPPIKQATNLYQIFALTFKDIQAKKNAPWQHYSLFAYHKIDLILFYIKLTKKPSESRLGNRNIKTRVKPFNPNKNCHLWMHYWITLFNDGEASWLGFWPGVALIEWKEGKKAHRDEMFCGFWSYAVLWEENSVDLGIKGPSPISKIKKKRFWCSTLTFFTSWSSPNLGHNHRGRAETAYRQPCPSCSRQHF